MRRMLARLGGMALAALLVVAPAGAQSRTSVEEAAVGRAIVDRMPADTGSTFSRDVGMLYAWTRVSGAEGQTIHHVWLHEGQEMADVALAVGGSPWRTWSSKNIVEYWTGQWSVEVRDGAGRVLDTVRFAVRP